MSNYPCCKGIGLTSTEAKTEKHDMQELNNKLAFFIQWVRELKSASSVGGDMSSYHDAMRQLENELVKLKTLYESELEKLRTMLFQANSEKNLLVVEAQKMSSSQGRLAQEASKTSQLEMAILQLEKDLGVKEKELAELRSLLKQREQQANSASQYMAECETLRLRLTEESQQRRNFEAKLKELSEKYRFEVQVHGNQQKDLQERVQAANEIILALEVKMKTFNKMGDHLPAALQKLREGSVLEMKRFQGETEAALNKNMEVIRQQMEFSDQAKQSMALEKRQLEIQIRELSGRLVEFETQNKVLLAENQALKKDIDYDRSRAQLSISELEAKLKELQNHLLCHSKEFVHARDAQASLRTEIEAYRALLDVENGRLNSRAQLRSGSGTMVTAGSTTLPALGKCHASGGSQSKKVSIGGEAMACGKNETGSYKASFELSGGGSGSCGVSLAKSSDSDRNMAFSWAKASKTGSTPNGCHRSPGGYRGGVSNSYDTTYKVNYTASTGNRNSYFN